MSTSPLGWALLAAFGSGFAWAGLDVTRKRLGRDVRPTTVAAGLSLGLAILFGVAAALTSLAFDASRYVAPAAVSVVFNLAVQLSILESVRRGELSRTIPLLSLTPVMAAIFGLVVLGEEPSARQWAGIGLVFVGAAVLGTTRGDGARGTGLLAFRLDSGAGLMVVAALSISAASPFDKLAVQASSAALHGFVQSLLSALVLLLFLGWRRRLSFLGRAFRRRPAMSVAAVLGFAALGLQFVAYGGAMVGVVETVKRVVGLAMSLVTGRLVFGETITPGTLVAVAVMAVGVALLLV